MNGYTDEERRLRTALVREKRLRKKDREAVKRAAFLLVPGSKGGHGIKDGNTDDWVDLRNGWIADYVSRKIAAELQHEQGQLREAREWSRKCREDDERRKQAGR